MNQPDFIEHDQFQDDYQDFGDPSKQNSERTIPKPANIQQRTLIESLIGEYSIVKKGFLQQEFRDYCMVKGASEQTIPLVLFVPLLMLLGSSMCVLVLFKNLRDSDPIIWSFVKTGLFIFFSISILYVFLKGFEIVPKVIRNPLLIGRITTYIFSILLVVEGFEFAVLNPNTHIIKNQFWATIALLIWQKLLITFIYDMRLRACYYLCIYCYFACRVGQDYADIFYNLYKCSLYVGVEIIIIIDHELKNYGSYQLEKQMTQTTNKLQNQESVKFMIPSISIEQQQKLLQNYSNIFPVAIFDSKRVLLHLSGILQKQLQLDIKLNQEQEVDLIDAELALRKLEIVHVYDEYFTKQQEVKKLKRQTLLGSTCGLTHNGELLHSLLNGPALQQLRIGVQAPAYLLGAQQPEQFPQGPRHLNFSSEGLLDKIMSRLIQSDKEQVQGLVQHKIKSKTQKDDKKYFSNVKFYQFTLSKDPLSQSSEIILVLEDVTSLMGFINSKQKLQNVNEQDLQQLKDLCLKTRSFASIQEQMLNDNFYTYDILRSVSNLESQIAGREQNVVHIHAETFNLEALQSKIKRNFEQRSLDKNNKFTIHIDEQLKLETFLTDNSKLQMIVENLLENSLEATSDGIIKLNIGPDIRSHCVSISIEDNGTGIPNAFFAKLNPNSQMIQQLFQSEQNNGEVDSKKNHIGIESSNLNAKLIGPMIMSKSIGGHICSSGLHILSEKDIGTKITFSVRNMTLDVAGQIYMIDKSVDDSPEELELEQEEILERYICGKEQAQEDLFIIPRANQNIKCLILKQSFTPVVVENLQKQDQQLVIIPTQVKQKLAGLTKLQESGRRPIIIEKKNRFLNSGISTSPAVENLNISCDCDSILIINSNYQFGEVMKAQKMNILWYERAIIVREKEALRQINRKMKDNSCLTQCQAYKTIVLNCSNSNVDYQILINQIISLYLKSSIQMGRLIVLNYRPFGVVPPKVLIVQMPNTKWSELIA